MKTCRNEKESLKKQYKKLQNQNLKKMLSGTNGPPYDSNRDWIESPFDFEQPEQYKKSFYF